MKRLFGMTPEEFKESKIEKNPSGEKSDTKEQGVQGT
jgi:hypothetical protein